MGVPDYFGTLVFNEGEMRRRLPENVFAALKRVIDDARSLDPGIADEVATAMKDWALEHGATHFTHWFQPLTGITAEKHESFLSPAEGGRVIMEFSGRELIRGESDASSFPSGGLRATFEARGYTAWDPTSYAFIKGNTLCVPTAFCSWGGEALDTKTPLLRSMEAVNRQALRILRLFGNDTARTVVVNVGTEQEYFLVDREIYEKRPDLIYTGRTLFGARPPKGQELDDHYYGAIKPRVAAFMKELDEELWKLGIIAKTEHNEAAPSQYELAQRFIKANIATDQNQLMMEMMQRTAKNHGMVCLLHEKPFKGVAGSGKHDNWSLSTGDGVNLLDPGKTPEDNAQFLLFLVAVLRAADDYQDLLRLSVASAGNDHRLGSEEAPPAIISVFLGSELEAILESIENGNEYTTEESGQLRLGVHVLPKLPKDTSDRNRTSPLAFTGNKFEFRMPGSAESTAHANIMLNTAVAESLMRYADELESVPPEAFNPALHDLIAREYRAHKRIVFNGNGYGAEWLREARETRGLSELPSTPDAVVHLTDEKNLALFSSQRLFTEAEARSRAEIILDHYNKVINIEALTMTDLVFKKILPAVYRYEEELCRSAESLERVHGTTALPQRKTLAELSVLAGRIYDGARNLSSAMADVHERFCDPASVSSAIRELALPAMSELREAVDAAELICPEDAWPLPSYGKILFSL